MIEFKADYQIQMPSEGGYVNAMHISSPTDHSGNYMTEDGHVYARHHTGARPLPKPVTRWMVVHLVGNTWRSTTSLFDDEIEARRVCSLSEFVVPVTVDVANGCVWEGEK